MEDALMHNTDINFMVKRHPSTPSHGTWRKILTQCQLDAPDKWSYIACVVTKPPETVLVLLRPPNGNASPSSTSYVLLDSHPRPNCMPHRPNGSYALFHTSLDGLVGSLKKIFPVTNLGSDVPEMMAVMYNSFDVYPFQYQQSPHT